MGKLEAAVPQCGLDALAALFHRIIGQPNHVEVSHARRAYIHLNFD